MLAVLIAAGLACSGPRPSVTPIGDPTAESLAAEVAQLRATTTAAAAALPTATLLVAAPTAASPSPIPSRSPLVAGTAASPQPGPGAGSFEDAVALVSAYTVFVLTDTGPTLGSGSGVSIGDGKVVTSYHVVEDAQSVWVRFPSGREEPVRVVGADPRRDLALLQSSFGSEPFAPMGSSASLRQGAAVFAVGFPHAEQLGALTPSVTRGIFSARRRSASGVWFVQTDTPLNPGNSGGPLADDQGRLLGIISFGLPDAVGLNFTVAEDEVQAFLANPGPVPTPPPAVALPTAAPARPTPVARPTPTQPPQPPAAPQAPRAVITAPRNNASVPERLVIQGSVSQRFPPSAHLWLIVRALPEGAWYPGPGEILVNPDGTWSTEIYLGGPAGTQHDIRVGFVDEDTHRRVLRFKAEQPDQPLTGWDVAETFGDDRVVVRRQ